MANKKEREVKERNQERKKAGRKEQDVYINAAIIEYETDAFKCQEFSHSMAEKCPQDVSGA